MQHSIPADDGHAQLLGHMEWIRGLARRLVQDEARADDITQDALLRGLGSAPREPGHLRAWLSTVVGNLARERYRGDVRRLGREREAARQEATSDHTELIGEAEAHHNLVVHVLALDNADRVALLQRYFQGLTPREIAAREGRTTAQVSHDLTRAHAALRARLEREGGRERWLTALIPLVSRPEPKLAAALAAPLLMSTGTLMAGAVVTLVALAVLFTRGLGAPPAAPSPKIAPTLDEDTEAALERDPTLEFGAAPIETGVRVSATPQALETPLPEAETLLEDSLPTSVTIRGRLIDTAGDPLPGRRVHLVRRYFPRTMGPEFLERVYPNRRVARVKTDADGAFVMPDIPLGQYAIGAVARLTPQERLDDKRAAMETGFPVPLDGHRKFCPIVETIDVGAETEEEEVVVVAQYGGRIGGLVQYPDGRPALGVSVYASRKDVEGAVTRSSGPDGRFEFDALPPGVYTISGHAQEATPGWILTRKQSARVGDLSLVFTLEPAAFAAGRCYDAATGEGIDAKCWFVLTSNQQSPVISGEVFVESDRGGSFCFSNLPPDVYDFAASSKDKTRFGVLRNVALGAGVEVQNLEIKCFPAARVELDNRSSDALVEVVVVESEEPIISAWVQPRGIATIAVPPGRLELTFYEGDDRMRPRTVRIEAQVGEPCNLLVPD